MRHLWKQQSLQDLVRYNKWLLMITVVLSILSLILGISLIQKEERWVLIPAIDLERKFIVTNKEFHESYVKEWARGVMKQMFTTSVAEIDNQIADIRLISRSNKDLDSFFERQLTFVKGSNVSSVFFFKSAKAVESGVEVTGTLHYWFANSDTKVAEEKTYLLSYIRSGKGLLLLANIEEIKKSKAQS